MVSRILLDLDIKKTLFGQTLRFYHCTVTSIDFYRLVIATWTNPWEPRLFIHLINDTRRLLDIV